MLPDYDSYKLSNAMTAREEVFERWLDVNEANLRDQYFEMRKEEGYSDEAASAYHEDAFIEWAWGLFEKDGF